MTKDKDLGWYGFTKRIEEMDKTIATIGLHEDAGSYPDGDHIPDIGFFNEYGATNANIPERSFIRSTIEEKLPVLKQKTEELKNEIITNAAPVKAGLAKIAFYIQESIKGKITDIKFPPNAISTIRRKGFDDPLIESQLMQRSITFKVK